MKSSWSSLTWIRLQYHQFVKEINSKDRVSLSHMSLLLFILMTEKYKEIWNTEIDEIRCKKTKHKWNEIGREKEEKSSRNCTLIGPFDRFVMFCVECNRWTVIKTKISPCLLAFHAYHFDCVSERGGGVTQSLTPATNKPLKQKHGKKNSPHVIQKKTDICAPIFWSSKLYNYFPSNELVRRVIVIFIVHR